VSEVVLDASALLAVLFGEPGAEVVRPHLSRAIMSAVNYAEVLTRATHLTGKLEDTTYQINRTRVTVVPFNVEQATVTASLVELARPYGLSLPDRACLALALTRHGRMFTTDRIWQKLDLAITIEVIC
jgi:ribonuclease VapC